jgi:tRNA modification GTPase
LLAGDLTAALNALGEITGETVGDDLLDLIFTRFCIGK